MKYSTDVLTGFVKGWLLKEYGREVPETLIRWQKTSRDFEGDITLNVFPLLSLAGCGPEELAGQLGKALSEGIDFITGHHVVRGFLNLVVADSALIALLNEMAGDALCEQVKAQSETTVMVEFSSPNTNKPLHLGHIRNNLLGWSVAEILRACGHKVIRTQIINDRGIHICKSMLAWQRWGGGETPESSGMKGDALVGKYYVEFEKRFRREVAGLVQGGMDEESAKAASTLMKEAQAMLQKWEAKDPEVYALWKKMNAWVYNGFDKTYKSLGVDFDKLYYESDTYLLGKQLVEDGLEQGVLFKKDDGSVWCDLSDEGLDEKLLIRADGTAVYMTQDIGTAVLRFKEFSLDNSIYVVGNEQNYHFQVLFLILKKLGYKWVDHCFHLSYGMVDLPDGKMKSREGKVVDADELVAEMVKKAEQATAEQGKTGEMPPDELGVLCRQIGLGALKYFILKVDPKKRMLFNPDESIDLNGNTGPFLQYTHARICSLLHKAAAKSPGSAAVKESTALLHEERNLISALSEYPGKVKEAGRELNPAIIANYLFELSKNYNHFYQEVPVLKAEQRDQRQLRLLLSEVTGRILASGLRLLGMEAPERM